MRSRVRDVGFENQGTRGLNWRRQMARLARDIGLVLLHGFRQVLSKLLQRAFVRLPVAKP